MATNDEVATHLGISPTRVSELKSAGILPEARRRANNLTDCRAAYLAHLRETAAGRQSRDGGGLDLVAERALLAREQRKKIERQNAVEAGEFIRVAEFHLMMTSSFSRVRAKLLSLPSKLAPLVAAKTTPAEAQQILKAAIYETLNELGSTRVTGISDSGDLIYTETEMEREQ